MAGAATRGGDPIHNLRVDPAGGHRHEGRRSDPQPPQRPVQRAPPRRAAIRNGRGKQICERCYEGSDPIHSRRQADP
jgi:hypothetical protein